ncbi:hypothetical protein RB597_000523 [Gaeumannomyces tritici]
MSAPSPRPKLSSSSSGLHHHHSHHLTRDGSDRHHHQHSHHTAYSHRHSCKTQSPYRHGLPQQKTQQHSYRRYSTLNKMTGSSSNQAGSAVSSSSSSAAASASGMMQYYYDTDASYGFMQQEPAWLMATPIDDDDLTFGGKSLSTWYEEDRRRFSLGDESSRTMESDEEEESRGRQRVRAHYDAPSTSHRHHKSHGSKGDAVKH